MPERKVEVIFGWSFEKKPVLIVRGEKKEDAVEAMEGFVSVLCIPVQNVTTNLGSGIMALSQTYHLELRDEAGEYFGLPSTEMTREHPIAVHASR